MKYLLIILFSINAMAAGNSEESPSEKTQIITFQIKKGEGTSYVVDPQNSIEKIIQNSLGEDTIYLNKNKDYICTSSISSTETQKVHSQVITNKKEIKVNNFLLKDIKYKGYLRKDKIPIEVDYNIVCIG
tara:strand:- start:62301 stop:62690 length:390 start_codon:yes stop_codon:yes gene_type:complete